MKHFYKLSLILVFLGACSPPVSEESWCKQPVRHEFSSLEEVETSSQWFKVYRASKGVFAIAEPFNFQEVISYLIIGAEKNILFDTGMGMDSISKVVAELSPNPVIVINSHTHFDHIGGNHEFDTIYAVDTAYTHHFATEGWTHDQVRQEVAPNAFCMDKLPSLDTANYAVLPYSERIKHYLKDGEVVDIGDRKIEILRVPGHTPDGIALHDLGSGYLFTGDNYYPATIWLFFDGTDLKSYEKSVARFATLAPFLTKVFPAHNATAIDPARLLEFREAFQQVKLGNAKEKTPQDKVATTLEVDGVFFKIRRDFLKKFME